MTLQLSVILSILSLTSLSCTTLRAQTDRYDALANSPMAENRPTPETAATLKDELLFERATQTYLWALPLVNTLGMKIGSEEKFGAGYNVLPIWKKRLDAKTLITTPNSDVIYAMSYLDLGKDGPLVFDAPPEMQGILMDFWQRPIPVDGGEYFGDVGLFGPDQGKGGKFLLLPPGYKDSVPSGYYVYRSGTNNVFVFLRAFYADPKNLDPPVRLLQSAKIYPLKNEKGAKPMQFPDGSGVSANMLPRSDFSAFEQLKALIDSEPSSIASDDARHACHTRNHQSPTLQPRCENTSYARCRGENWLQNQPSCRLRGQSQRAFLRNLSRSALAQPVRLWNPGESVWRVRKPRTVAEKW